MKSWQLLVLIILLSCAEIAAMAEGTMGKRMGVIVGVIQETHPLNFTLNDAKLMRTLLERPGDQINLLTSEEGGARPKRGAILAAVQQMASTAKPEDSLWFYYSGHGTQWKQDERSYIIPEDATGEIGSMIAISEIRKIMLQSRAKTKLVIIDACQSASSRASALPDLEQAFGKERGVITLAGCEVNQSSLEMPHLRHGLFTFFLARGLAGAASPNPGQPITLNSLQMYVTTSIKKFIETGPPSLKNSRQTPVFFVTPEQAGMPIGLPNPEIVAANPVPGTAEDVRPMRPIPPGIIVALHPSEDTDPRLARQVEQTVQKRFRAEHYPVIAPELAAQFAAILNDRRSEVAAEQAAKMNAQFLLRGEVDASVRSLNVAGEQIFSATVTVRLELLDSEGHVLAAESSTDDNGSTVRKAAGIADNALTQAAAEAGETATIKTLRTIDARLKALIEQAAQKAAK